ncbi:MAG: LacI family transcriptional regulator [Micromonosporaceae bacterium]|nr:LacI family transcriptional regulator [Micromonosporaceae bacterium]
MRPKQSLVPYADVMQRVKLTDVARAAGVHPGTASRALNPPTRDQVSRETSRRVARAAERLGYVPNAAARGLRTARSYIVAMVVPDVTNPLFPPMVRGAEQVLSKAGYTLVLTDTDNEAATERRQIELLRARGTDGFIVATARWKDPLLDEMADARIPAVLVNRNTSSARLPYIGGDERTGIALAVDHLVRLRHRRISYLAGPQDTSTGRERAAAFHQAIRNHGLPTYRGQVRVCRAYTEAGGAVAAHTLITSGHDCTAIIAGNDLIAFGVLSELAKAGISCPGHMSLIGFNDLPMVDKLTPPLTTVRLPLPDMGRLAAHVLLTEIDATAATERVAQSLLGVELVIRGTTGPAVP